MKIVILDAYVANPGDLSWDGLKEFGELTTYERSAAHEIVERAKDAEAVYINKTILSREILKQLPKLKFIGVLATGYNVLDIETATEQGIVVCNIPAYSTMSVVQMVYALLLELCMQVKVHSDAVDNGEWVTSKDFCFIKHPLVELSGKTMGIIGLGQIGRGVADVAAAFGMKVIAHSRTRTDQSHRKEFEWKEVHEIFEQSDVISLHCPLSEQTQGIVSTENIGRMKKSAFLINASRGALVDEQALANALNEERIAGAALDVLSTEPPKPDNPLLGAKNCLIMPHIAWATKEARIRLLNTAAANLKAFMEGKPINKVN